MGLAEVEAVVAGVIRIESNCTCNEFQPLTDGYEGDKASRVREKANVWLMVGRTLDFRGATSWTRMRCTGSFESRPTFRNSPGLT
jgi:hypothetical protein